MPTDNSFKTNMAISMNPMLHTNKPGTKDKIKAIIKNQNGDQLVFKDKQDNWEPITIKRLDRCSLKTLMKDILKQIFPSIRIDSSLLVLSSVKVHDFHAHEYIFDF